MTDICHMSCRGHWHATGPPTICAHGAVLLPGEAGGRHEEVSDAGPCAKSSSVKEQKAAPAPEPTKAVAEKPTKVADSIVKSLED